MQLYAGQACNNLMLDLQDTDMMNAFSPAPDGLPLAADEPQDGSQSARDTPAKA